MQTVTFQCGGCNRLMAVSVEYLGHQVRCPHCQAVVLAPAAAPAPAPPPPPAPVPPPALTPPPSPAHNALESALLKSTASSEDIFNQPGETEDALFGPAAEPRLSLSDVRSQPVLPPAAPLPPPVPEPVPVMELEPPPMVVEQVTPDASDGLLDAVEVAEEAQPQAAAVPLYPEPPPPRDAMPLPYLAPTPPPVSEPTAPPQVQRMPWSSAEPAPDQEEPHQGPRVRRPAESKKMGLFIPLVFLPLLIWAIAATAAAVWGWFEVSKAKERQNPFDRFPDVDGDTPGVKKPRPVARVKWDRDRALAELPKHLRVKLGNTLTIGSLEITPLNVKVARVTVGVNTSNEKEVLANKSLVLNLRLKNLSQDQAFAPLDAYFDRQLSKKSDNYPLTVLQAGKDNVFFGGSADWSPTSSNKRRFWVDRPGAGSLGVFRELQPNETLETFVATDGEDPEIQRILLGQEKTGKGSGKRYTGPLLWRVQVRRGTVLHNGEERSATAVVGVEFTDKDIPAG